MPDGAHLEHKEAVALGREWVLLAQHLEGVRVTANTAALAKLCEAAADSAVDLGGVVDVAPTGHDALGTESRGRKCQRREDDGSEQSASGEHFSVCAMRNRTEGRSEDGRPLYRSIHEKSGEHNLARRAGIASRHSNVRYTYCRT